MKIKLLGIDLAKNVFQLCALNQANKVDFNRTVRRARLRSTVAKLAPTTIAMEACSSAHYWGRAFETMGHHSQNHIVQVLELESYCQVSDALVPRSWPVDS